VARRGGGQAPWRLRHRRSGLIVTAMPGRQSLRLAHASDVQGHHAILAPKAVAMDGPAEMRAIPTPPIPAGQEDGLYGARMLRSRPCLGLTTRVPIASESLNFAHPLSDFSLGNTDVFMG
jgi:hypothetical protein